MPLPRAGVEDPQLSPRTPEQRGLDCPRRMAEEITSQWLNSWPEGRTGTASERPQRPLELAGPGVCRALLSLLRFRQSRRASL